jgi:molybdopterin-containing oxidoreductase family iron-sulfur binding subunit
MPWLQENPAVHVDGAWDSWLEIHPEAALGLGVNDGDLVTVESAAGEVTVRARLFAGTRPDVVAIPVGQGHTSTGRWARGRGVDPSDLLTSVKEPGEGLGIAAETRVRIRPA